MKITSLIAAFVVTVALTALGQEGVVQEVKHGAKKAGETVKDGLETVGEKTKETVNGTGEKASGTQKTHHKSSRSANKAKAQTTEEQTTDRDSNTPAP